MSYVKALLQFASVSRFVSIMKERTGLMTLCACQQEQSVLQQELLLVWYSQLGITSCSMDQP